MDKLTSDDDQNEKRRIYIRNRYKTIAHIERDKHAHRMATDPEYAEKRRKRTQRWRNANPEKVTAYHANRMQSNPSYKEKRRQYSKQYRIDNHQKVRESAMRLRSTIEYRAKDVENQRRRRARKYNAPTVEKIDRQAIIERDRSICHICRRKVSQKNMSLDHLISLANGGAHTSVNLAVAHKRCNSRRGADRFPAQRRLF